MYTHTQLVAQTSMRRNAQHECLNGSFNQWPNGPTAYPVVEQSTRSTSEQVWRKLLLHMMQQVVLEKPVAAA